MLLSFILQLTALLALGNAQSAPGNGTKPAPAAGGLVWGKATSSACPDCQAYDVCREQRGNYPMVRPLRHCWVPC
ncbi:hypothetical protein EJ06DRAFT_262582 [Trichodelitschia bisporula]|uniref:Secreted protein n=1 Tax=Trichodelitschia bisporula TaxID=703511 RepID=A0A6G1HIT1_9PEZI|nr:hypothetical protein EJ06DRAFT_262582 [Trichodelitschia bisporula]